MYRIEPPDVDGLLRFGETALAAGGVFIRTEQVHRPATSVVVCVVHPVSGDLFQLNGMVENSPPQKSDGIAVRFEKSNEQSAAEFQLFVALGVPDDDSPAPWPSSSEEETFAEDTVVQQTMPENRTSESMNHDIRSGGTMDIELSDLELVEDLE